MHSRIWHPWWKRPKSYSIPDGLQEVQVKGTGAISGCHYALAWRARVLFNMAIFEESGITPE